ncbi:hypothetical protein [uncultured Sunxiuqinia sp.]|uniref:hypothetical protein n=1 Tax=uncultured Sunxiuqinia sp. TaxID=1573825 RepID=UPI00263309BD|nr:hypothetical protein [uncultured Sunxiuqinia sp.]
MKTLLQTLTVITLMAVSTTTAKAQSRLIRNQGFFYGVEGFYGHGTSLRSTHRYDVANFSPSSYGLKVSTNWFSGFHFSSGLTAGVLNYESPGMLTFPLLVNGQGYLSKGANTPLVYAEVGYGLRFNHKNQDKGLLYEAGIGYRHRIQRNNFWVVKAGFQGFHNKEWLWDFELGENFDPNHYIWYDLKRQTITLTLGFYYSTRY